MSTMRITSAGQLSLPAEIRRRWNVNRVRLVDHGDHVTLEPIPDDVIAATFGRFASIGSGTADARDAARAHDVERENRRVGVRRVSARSRTAG